jgi:hypothetical protein
MIHTALAGGTEGRVSDPVEADAMQARFAACRRIPRLHSGDNAGGGAVLTLAAAHHTAEEAGILPNRTETKEGAKWRRAAAVTTFASGVSPPAADRRTIVAVGSRCCLMSLEDHFAVATVIAQVWSLA